MRRIIIALVAFVGLTGFAEAYPAHHYHHYRMAYGYRHHVPHLHLRAPHRYSGYYRHAYRVRHRAAALRAGPRQPALFGTQEQPQAAGAQTWSFAPSSEAGRVVRASWYGGGERLSSRTASGEHFDRGGLTAAHRSLPFGTRVQVTNVQTGRAVVVRINDRGPFVRGRSLDLARGAAQAIGLSSVGQVRMVVLN
jgi:rare lipoprotein A